MLSSYKHFLQMWCFRTVTPLIFPSCGVDSPQLPLLKSAQNFLRSSLACGRGCFFLKPSQLLVNAAECSEMLHTNCCSKARSADLLPHLNFPFSILLRKFLYWDNTSASGRNSCLYASFFNTSNRVSRSFLLIKPLITISNSPATSKLNDKFSNCMSPLRFSSKDVCANHSLDIILVSPVLQYKPLLNLPLLFLAL